jgi:outer membrane receptor protein involved in Fe transport
VKRRSFVVLAVSLAASLGVAGDLLAKDRGTDCGARLDEARRLFDLGRLERVEAELAECLDRGFSLDQRLVALQLVAEVRLAEDDLKGAREAVGELLRLDPQIRMPDARPLLAALIQEQRGTRTARVSSVSKTAESSREAPASVIVITAEEIARRGYLDLEQVLHDLPGFDISRTQGQPYSNIYPRGLRTTETNRLLLLVDGVEENDLATGAVWLSRQYSLSNVERIEVIYGPSSTLYGANAYAGVINVITRSPESLVADGERFGVSGEVTAGSWNTRSVDVTVAGSNRAGSLRWSLTGRRYTSDEFDLSGLEDPLNDDWDFDPGYYETVDYGRILGISAADGVAGFLSFLAENPELDCRGQADCFFAILPDGTVGLTEAGRRAAVARDQAALTRPVGGRLPGFSDPTDDWLIHAKVQTTNLELGFQSWYREEAFLPFLTDRFGVGGDNGKLWIPKFTWLYMRYSRAFPENHLTLNVFSRYKRQSLDGDSSIIQLRNYERGRLGLEDLLLGTDSLYDARFETRNNNQLRTEISAVYEPSERFNLVAGFEARFSSVGAVNIVSREPNPAATGEPDPRIPGGNDIDSQDLGLYLQASYRLRPQWKVVAGGRVDNNRIRSSGGYGTVFNPRLALVYTPGPFTVKAIYAEAFQDAPNFQRFAVSPGSRELPAEDLQPARLRNVDLVVGWKPNDRFEGEVVLYRARYSDLIEEVSGVPCTQERCSGPFTAQFQNTGEVTVSGLQATALYTTDLWSAYANYTTTDPENRQGLRIADIAEHQFNLGASRTFGEKWVADLRANYVGERKVGAGTAPGTNPAGTIDDFLVLHGSLIWKKFWPRVEGLQLQLTVNNLLDEEYFHPGVRSADGTVFASRLPQPERAFFLRLRYSR